MINPMHALHAARRLRSMTVVLALFVGAAISMVSPAAKAVSVEPGQPLPSLQIKDQHDGSWAIDADARLVIFAAGRKASNLALEVLGDQPKGFLATRHAVYLADMSRMPGFITRTFALPSLREQPFKVGVSLEEKTLADWPRQDDALTLIQLDEKGKVSRIGFVTSAAELRKALDL